MKRSFLSAFVIVAAITAVSSGVAPTTHPAGKVFAITLRNFESKDAMPTLVSQPVLTTEDGSPTSFLAGGQISADLGHGGWIDFGVKSIVTVHERTPDHLRVLLDFSHSALDYSNASVLTDGRCPQVRETALHVLKDVRPGEAFTVDLGDGHSVEVTVDAK